MQCCRHVCWTRQHVCWRNLLLFRPDRPLNVAIEEQNLQNEPMSFTWAITLLLHMLLHFTNLGFLAGKVHINHRFWKHSSSLDRISSSDESAILRYPVHPGADSRALLIGPYGQWDFCRSYGLSDWLTILMEARVKYWDVLCNIVKSKVGIYLVKSYGN